MSEERMSEERIGLGIKTHAEKLKMERLNLKREREALEQEKGRLEERQRSLEEDLQEKTQKIETKEEELQEKEKELEEKKKELYLTAEELDKKRAEIEKLQKKFSSVDLDKIEDTLREIEKREAELARREEDLDMKAKALADTEKTIDIREEELAKKQAFLIEREKELIDREDETRQKLASLNEREMAIMEQEKVLSERLDGLLSSEIKGLMDSTVERFNSLESDLKNNIISAVVKEENLIKRSGDIEKDMARLRDLEKRLVEREESILAVEKELELLLSDELETNETNAEGVEAEAEFAAKADVHEAMEETGIHALREPEHLPEEPGMPPAVQKAEIPQEKRAKDVQRPSEPKTAAKPENPAEKEADTAVETADKNAPEAQPTAQKEKMSCPVCGAEIDANVDRCPICGADIPAYYRSRSKETIQGAQKQLAEAYNRGLDISEIKRILNLAKAAYGEENFKEAQKLAEECIAEAKRVMGNMA